MPASKEQVRVRCETEIAGSPDYICRECLDHCVVHGGIPRSLDLGKTGARQSNSHRVRSLVSSQTKNETKTGGKLAVVINSTTVREVRVARRQSGPVCQTWGRFKAFMGRLIFSFFGCHHCRQSPDLRQFQREIRSKCRPQNYSSMLFSSLTVGPSTIQDHCTRRAGAVCTRARFHVARNIRKTQLIGDMRV